jgi:hypothetical protein
MTDPQPLKKVLASTPLPRLGDTRALDLIATELSVQEWSPDTIDTIAGFVRATGRTIYALDEVTTVWTLTVNHDKDIQTTVHHSESDAIKCLFDNFDPAKQYRGDMQALMDGERLVIKIDEHWLLPEQEPRDDGD